MLLPKRNGAKHSPPGGKFQKSGGPHASGGVTPFHNVSLVNSNPNDEFSIQTMMIFDVDSNCVHPRF